MAAYVGVAYQLGSVMKYSFYSCDDGSGSASGSSRRLASSGGALVECVGIGYGVLYSAAYFLLMFQMWFNDAFYRARYEATDVVHRLADLLQYLLLVIAAANISPVPSPPPSHILQVFAIETLHATTPSPSPHLTSCRCIPRRAKSSSLSSFPSSA